MEEVYSLCQRFLQWLRWAFLCYTTSPVFWAELGQKIPQDPYHLLGLGVQTDPVWKKMVQNFVINVRPTCKMLINVLIKHDIMRKDCWQCKVLWRIRQVCVGYLKAMTLPGVSFWKVISCTNSDRPLDVTPACFTTVLSWSYTCRCVLLWFFISFHLHKEWQWSKKWWKQYLQGYALLFPQCILACHLCCCHPSYSSQHAFPRSLPPVPLPLSSLERQRRREIVSVLGSSFFDQIRSNLIPNAEMIIFWSYQVWTLEGRWCRTGGF